MSESDFLVYQSDDGELKLDISFDGDTLWLTQGQMAKLFGIDRTGISRHIKYI